MKVSAESLHTGNLGHKDEKDKNRDREERETDMIEADKEFQTEMIAASEVVAPASVSQADSRTERRLYSFPVTQKKTRFNNDFFDIM